MSETVTSAPAVAPSTSGAPAAAPSTSAPSAGGPSSIPSPSDIFAELEQKMGFGSSPEHTPGEAKQYRDGTAEDLENLNAATEETQEDSAATQPTETEVTEDTQIEDTNTEPEFPELVFEGRVGDKDYKFKIRDAEHLNKIVTRAIHAEKLYQQNREMLPKMKELESLRSYREQFDKLASESPAELLDMIVEDMGEEDAKAWILKTADYLSQPKEKREMERKLKQAEMLEMKLQAIQEQQENLKKMRQQAAAEADKKAINSWHESWMQKTAAKVPEQYLDIVKDRLYDTRREAKERQDNGETITLKTLDRIFARKMKPVLDLINSGKGKVTQEVGRTLDQKRQQNVDKMRAAAASQLQSGSRPQTTMQRHVKDSNVRGIFDEIMKNIDSGTIRIRGA